MILKPLDGQVADEEDEEGKENQIPHEFVMSSFRNIRQSAHGRLKEAPGRVKFVVHIAKQLILTANLVADINRQRFQGTHLERGRALHVSGNFRLNLINCELRYCENCRSIIGLPLRRVRQPLGRSPAPSFDVTHSLSAGCRRASSVRCAAC